MPLPLANGIHLHSVGKVGRKACVEVFDDDGHKLYVPAETCVVTAPPALKIQYENSCGGHLLGDIAKVVRSVPEISNQRENKRGVYFTIAAPKWLHGFYQARQCEDYMQHFHAVLTKLRNALVQASVEWDAICQNPFTLRANHLRSTV